MSTPEQLAAARAAGEALADDAPPLTPEQRAELAALTRPALRDLAARR